MDIVTVKRTELLGIVKKNREAHAQLYKDAVEGFQVDVKKKLERAMKKVDAGELMSGLSFQVPVDHTEQYDTVIAMLEMSVDENIELRMHEFQNYVQDKWISASEKALMRGLALSSSNARAYLNQ